MSKDELRISEFYHNQDADKPSNELDKIILAEAQQAIPVKSQWRKWQWPASVAASIMFVSVILFTQYSSFNPNINDVDLSSTAQVDPFALADESTLDAEQQAFEQKQRRRQEVQILAKRQTQEQQARVDKQRFSAAKEFKSEGSSSELLAQPESANFAQKEAATLGARALDNIELDILPFEQEASAPLDSGLRQERDVDDVTVQIAESETQLVSKGAIQAPKQVLMANSDYLDQLLINYTDIRSQLDQLAEQNTAKVTLLKAQLLEIQNTVYNHLNLQKLAKPNLKIQSRYLEILHEQQQKSLVKDRANE